jgi:hypothetical protein
MQPMDDNVTLLVSNQSFDIDPVDIEISIDGQVIVQDEFDVQGDQLPQHNWQQYHLRLNDGLHSLVVKSEKGQAEQQAKFAVAGAHSCTIAFWYDHRSSRSKPKGFFTVRCGQRQVATM